MSMENQESAADCTRIAHPTIENARLLTRCRRMCEVLEAGRTVPLENVVQALREIVDLLANDEPVAWLWVNPDGSKEATFVPPEQDGELSTAMALAMGRKAMGLYTHPIGVDDGTSAFADEYQKWIDFFHAGEGDYYDFKRKYP